MTAGLAVRSIDLDHLDPGSDEVPGQARAQLPVDSPPIRSTMPKPSIQACNAAYPADVVGNDRVSSCRPVAESSTAAT